MEPVDRFKKWKVAGVQVVPKHPAPSVCFLLSFPKLENTGRQTSVTNCKFQEPDAGRLSPYYVPGTVLCAEW